MEPRDWFKLAEGLVLAVIVLGVLGWQIWETRPSTLVSPTPTPPAGPDQTADKADHALTSEGHGV